MASWKTTFLYKPWVLHFHVSESECKQLRPEVGLGLPVLSSFRFVMFCSEKHWRPDALTFGTSDFGTYLASNLFEH